jgi:hypothetical protein
MIGSEEKEVMFWNGKLTTFKKETRNITITPISKMRQMSILIESTDSEPIPKRTVRLASV